MRPEVIHEEAFAALGAVAIDAVDPTELAAILAHVDGCAECTAELAALRDMTALLAFSSPLAADTATHSRGRIRSKLISRAASEITRAPTPPTPIPPVVFPPPRPEAWRASEPRAGWRRQAEWLAIAATVLFVASLSALGWLWREREGFQDSVREQSTLAQLARTSVDSLRGALMSRDSLIAGITGKNVSMMTLASYGPNAPFANMFWDKARNTWTLVAHNMPALKPGRTYQLWLVTRQAKISAGTFVTTDGDAMMRSTYALPATELRSLAVTDEPEGGMPQPTSPPIIAASAR
jgi:hypothetical protein